MDARAVQLQRLVLPVQAPHELRLPHAALALNHQELLPAPHAAARHHCPRLHLWHADAATRGVLQQRLYLCRPRVQAHEALFGMELVQVGQQLAKVLPGIDVLRARS